MAKIIGNTTTTPMAIPDWNQVDATKADYIKNKPDILTESEIVDLIKNNGGGSGGGIVDQIYNSESENAQSGKAVAEALQTIKQPIIVDSVDEMTDTTKPYVLSTTGEIWTYQAHEIKGELTPNFTNLFNKNDVLVNMSYTQGSNYPATELDGTYITGVIPYNFNGYDITNPSIVRIKGDIDLSSREARIVYYRSVPTDRTTTNIRIYSQFNSHIAYTVEEDGTMLFPLGVKKTTTGTTLTGVQGSQDDLNLLKSFALSFLKSYEPITIDDVPDLIITLDEEITYTEAPSQTVYEWQGTGLYFNIIKPDTKEAEETVYSNFACENDFTIVGDEIWGSKNEDTYTRIVRHKIVNGVLTKLSEIQFNDVVHLNTLDYCPENDCLITGNGANDTNTEGNCFWIIPNASNLPNLTGRLNLSDVAIQYNVDIGFKVQAIWGDGNLGQHNFVYLLSNNNEVRRAIIHKNADGGFADTYTIVGDKFTITGATGFQGVDYYGGYIYMGFGGSKFALAKVDTNSFNAEVTEYPYCKSDGTAQTGVFQGVVVDKDYLWLYPNGISEGNYLVKYTR